MLLLDVDADMDSNLATKKAATKRIKQAVAEPTMARLHSWARPDEITTKRDGTKKGCVSQGHEDEERRSLPARLRRRSSSKSRRSQLGSLESMVRKESPERAQRATIPEKITCFTKLLEGLGPTAREVGEVRGQFTTIKSSETKSMNLQEGVKKLEEQESAINVVCLTKGEASWVITCKDDHEEEITQFDGETVEKMMINEISTFLSNVDNVKISPEGFESEVTGTVSCARMIFRTQC